MNVASIIDAVAVQIGKSRLLARLVSLLAAKASPESVILLDYPVHPQPRWDRAHPHQELYEIIDRNRATYRTELQGFLTFEKELLAIPAHPPEGIPSTEPCWFSGWMPGLDKVALYGMIATRRPRLFLEVGSGNSTKVARRAITDHNLETEIVSIDPCPRAEIDTICDSVIRQPVEDVGLDVFDALGAGDILYIDNSHRALMNSDVTVVFLDILPRLKPGVLVQIHDVTLPYDYPEAWIGRHYSEQYLLAAWLLARGTRIEIILANAFVSQDNALCDVLSPLWNKEAMAGVETHGCSFWFMMQ